ncbi:membrane protein containing Ion transport 2 domain protein, partial [mine drainage metagenome]
MIVASFGFYLLEDGAVSPLNSIYWAIVTLSTVGYGDVIPTTFWAKVFTIAVIAGDVFLVAYLVSVVIGVVGEEAQQRQLGTFGTDLRDHVVVIGYAGVGRRRSGSFVAQGDEGRGTDPDPR